MKKHKQIHISYEFSGSSNDESVYQVYKSLFEQIASEIKEGQQLQISIKNKECKDTDL